MYDKFLIILVASILYIVSLNFTKYIYKDNSFTIILLLGSIIIYIYMYKKYGIFDSINIYKSIILIIASLIYASAIIIYIEHEKYNDLNIFYPEIFFLMVFVLLIIYKII